MCSRGRALTKRLRLYRLGSEAVHRVWPDASDCYVCPLCLRGFPELAARVGDLTLEHAPPGWSGGKALALTCRECNNRAGAVLDHEMQHFDELLGFARRAMARPLHMRAEAGDSHVTVTVDTSDGGYRVFGRPKSNNPATQEQFDTALTRFGVDERFSLSLSPVKALRLSAAKVGWLRIAYIVAFAAWGYRYVASRELDTVRDQLRQPHRGVVAGFWAFDPNAMHGRRQLGRISLAAAVQTIVVQMGPHIIFLPVPGSGDPYAELSQNWARGAHFHLQADLIPWPESLVLAGDR